ncbi:MerR family transcriptional regulator [Bythopirellula polymerisocia]|uniref:Tetratricopeptide repeat protein n=1 Tax=Bythopirellula polymerisocia TaxID=2528003 RepID=A0A5C6D4C9_9BACT|nr:MerR family transcriptional regulator [Bythopirellula polymerisocia]TWU30106.1 Tetratricopeptide repeat protein [Bythopirellula polymerisocia]
MAHSPHLSLAGAEADTSTSVARWYTSAMLAELVSVPVATIRRWQRQGILVECHSVRRLAYFDFTEVTIARLLAALLHAGCSLRSIDRQLHELQRYLPGDERPLANPALVVAGRKLILRRGDDLSEPGGQLLIDFDAQPVANNTEALGEPNVLSLGRNSTEDAAETISQKAAASDLHLTELQRAALAWEEQGELAQAVETYRMMLVVDGPSADVNFALADVLYQMRDLGAARERFYMAVELDEEFVEARAMLGCVLSENNELELAVAALQGALSFHPDYADVHYHLAGVLDRIDESTTAEQHWRRFLELSPESPWAETARVRLGIRVVE